MARVLVVDDDAPGRAYLSLLCRHFGHEVTEAADGGEALKLVRETRPELVVTDLLMPVLDGFELVKEIRADPTISTTPVMFYTATYVINEARDLAAVCGVTQMLIKPAEPQEIEKAIDAALGYSATCQIEVPTEEYGRKHRLLLNERLLHRTRELEQEVEERSRTEAALRESEQRFRTLADSAPVLIWMVDAEGRGTYFNEAWTDFVGDLPTIIRQQGADWWAGLHPLDDERCNSAYSSALSDRQPFELEYRRRRADGTYRWVLDRAKPRFTSLGDFLGLIGSCVDITLHKQLQEQLVHAQKMEGLGRMASSVAHDFNNYLTAIGGYAELIATSPPSDPNGPEFASRILQAAAGASELVRDLLAFARCQPVKKSLVDLNSVLMEIGPILQRLAGDAVRLEFRPNREIRRVEADAGRMEQVLMNLAVNACDAMDGEGDLVIETDEVVVDADLARNHEDANVGHYVTVSVTDSGSGVPEDVRSMIFEPFFTTKEEGKGTGLGLSTCYGIVKQSDGFIGLTTERGRGSTFTVYLPVAATAIRDAHNQEHGAESREAAA